MAQEDRETLEDIASEMGASRAGDMTDEELVAYIAGE